MISASNMKSFGLIVSWTGIICINFGMTMVNSICYEGLTEVLLGLNWQSVTVVMERRTPNVLSRIVKKLAMDSISASVLDNETLALQSIVPNVVVGDDAEVVLVWLHDILDVKLLRPPFTTLLVTENEDLFGMITENLATVDWARGFLLFECKEARLRQMQTTIGNATVPPVVSTIWPRVGKYYKEEFNLQGLNIPFQSLSYPPWLTLSDCDNATKQDCKATGICPDVLKIMSKHFNFTMSVSEEPNNDWGLDEVNGTVTGTGVFGNVYHGRVIDMTPWQQMLDKAPFVDATWPLMLNVKLVIVADFSHPPVDTTQSLHCFTPLSWLAIVVTLTILVIGYAFADRAPQVWLGCDSPPSEEFMSVQLILFSGWVGFLLLEAFFGGVLTMFFISVPHIPFRTLEQGIALYPDWKYVEDTIMLQVILDQGGESVVKYHDMLVDNGLTEELAGAGEAEIITKVAGNPGYFTVLLHNNNIEAYDLIVKNNLEVILDLSRITAGMILPRAYPLRKMFNQGILNMMESGVLDNLQSNAFLGQDWSELARFKNQVENQPLEPGRLGIMFFLMIGGYTLTAVTLMLEIIMDRRKHASAKLH